MPRESRRFLSTTGRLLALVLVCAVALQLFFFARIALMRWVDPQSSAFERSQAWRLLVEQRGLNWRQQWVDDDQISSQLKRAVIASEDAGFTEHSGVEWDAIEQAMERNQRAEARAEKINAQNQQRLEQQRARLEAQAARRGGGKTPPSTATPTPLAQPSAPPPPAKPPVAPKLVGGSTITQQLAKNLFLSGERNVARKAQEMLLTFMLEAALDKQRILVLYLNSVEWGEGVFGAQAAARHYFKTDAKNLSSAQAARLAVMLPAPKRFEKRPNSAYVSGRAAAIQARMGEVDLP